MLCCGGRYPLAVAQLKLPPDDCRLPLDAAILGAVLEVLADPDAGSDLVLAPPYRQTARATATQIHQAAEGRLVAVVLTANAVRRHAVSHAMCRDLLSVIHSATFFAVSSDMAALPDVMPADGGAIETLPLCEQAAMATAPNTNTPTEPHHGKTFPRRTRHSRFPSSHATKAAIYRPRPFTPARGGSPVCCVRRRPLTGVLLPGLEAPAPTPPVPVFTTAAARSLGLAPTGVEFFLRAL